MVHILDETTIQENYVKFRKLINNTFSGSRLESLNNMYDLLENRIVLTPASSTAHFHNAFAGGYIDHILRVTRNAIKVYDLYVEMGMGIGDHDKETVIFTALHHDLGKVGNDTDSWYIITDVPNGMKMFQRAALKTAMEGDFDTGNVRYKARERYSFGVSDYRGIFGVEGA